MAATVSFPEGFIPLQGPMMQEVIERQQAMANAALPEMDLLSHVCFGDPWIWAVVSTTNNEIKVLPFFAPSLGSSTQFDARRFYRQDIICSGSLGEGLWPFNLLAWCGLDLTEDDRDRVWSATTDERLLEQSAYCDWEVTGETDEVPGGSDEYRKYSSGNVERVKFDVRNAVFEILGQKDF